MKKNRKPKPDYFGLRELERIILHELEAADETTEDSESVGPLQNVPKPPELNPQTVATCAAKETTDASEDWGQHEGVFTAQEQRFISKAVEWLGPRENRDLILHAIMRGMDEGRPSPAAVFQPPQAQEARGAAEGLPAETH